MSLSTDLKELLVSKGATEVGFANLKGLENVPDTMPNAVSILIKFPAEIINTIQEYPTKIYIDKLLEINDILDDILLAGEDFLKKEGYNAYGQTKPRTVVEDDKRSKIPYKTAATRAGLGWIGKCALLVNPHYGSAVRIASIYTDAPLDFGKPVKQSYCGECDACVKACPGDACTGVDWHEGVDRNELYNQKKCGDKALELSILKTGIDHYYCGKCIIVCPFTVKYLKKELKK
ncbi:MULTISPECIES: 4Fe-4S double cluster binding domain-containing protein [unclassified Methanobrevibacter]|jgi:epoxyqueuosine reductase QueG|uniref:4Fe-4S double cluster binding domain-containing protein n=1 Tax=unclassified Methanobrevibacter TaxID=2638681 RepID=UPI0039B86E35